MRDLHSQHNEVFQVIYRQATSVEWHYFWIKHLVPFLKDAGDTNKLVMHAQQLSQWKNDDAEGVIAYWTEILAMDKVDKPQLACLLSHYIAEMSPNYLALCVPLLTELLKLPRDGTHLLGHAIARCVKNGCMEDDKLWDYIVGEIKEEDVHNYRFNQKLHCQPHEFGSKDKKFLLNQMQNYTVLLDLAVTSIEQWSQIRGSRHYNFLNETSYIDRHSQRDDIPGKDSERTLFDAVEAAIVHHANIQSLWWQSNRERLCFNPEGALRYFAILACISAPVSNLNVIGHMLCSKDLFESWLSHELGTILKDL